MSDLSVHPVYLSARAAIIAPERAIPLTLYSTQKWLPRLGPERWCLVLLLRSMSIETKRRGNGTKHITISWRQLAEILDVHEETVASWLKHQPIPGDKPWRQIIPSDEKSKNLAIFIPRLRYAYETRNGKTRRIGFLLEILMEDPVVPEDEAQLQQQIELLQLQQGSLGLETYRIHENVNTDNSKLPVFSENSHTQGISTLHNVNRKALDLQQQANPMPSDLHNHVVNRDNPNLQPYVKQRNFGSTTYVNQSFSHLQTPKSANFGKNVNELDILIQQLKQNPVKKNLRRQIFAPVIKLTEELLEDKHSTAMLYKVLNALYPERLDLYVSSVHVAVDEFAGGKKINKGAVFVRTLRDFADSAGVNLGLKRVAGGPKSGAPQYGNPGSHIEAPDLPPQSITIPPENEAIWTETQLVLRRQMTQATYDAIIQGTRLEKWAGDRFVVGVPTAMALEWLENRLHEIIQRALSATVGRPIQVEFELVTD